MPEQLLVEARRQLIGQSGNHSSLPYIHPATYSPFKYLLFSSPSRIQPTHGLNSSFSCMGLPLISKHTCFRPTATVLAANLEYPTRALKTRRTDIGRHCSSVEITQPGERTTETDIVMPVRYQSRQRVNSMMTSHNHYSPPYTQPAT